MLSGSPEETFELGLRFGRGCEGGEVFALSGPLGAGKTTFVKGLAAGLGIDPDTVKSPTFVLMTVHRGRLALAHADAYRVQDAEAFARDGWDELTAAVRAVEWADRIARILPAGAVWIRWAHAGGDRRDILIEGAKNPAENTATD